MAEVQSAIITGLGPFRRSTAWITVVFLSVLLLLILNAAGPFALVALLGGIIAVIALFRFPWLGALFLLASVSAQEFGALPLGGQSLTVTRAMFPLAVGGYVISILIDRRRLEGSHLLIPYVAFVGIVGASMVWASSITAAGAEFGRWMIGLVAFIVFTHFLVTASRRRILAFVGIMALGGVFQATYGVTQSVLALGPESFRVGTQGSRAFGTFGHPNSYAGYLEMVFFPAFWLAVWMAMQVPATLRTYIAARRNGTVASNRQRLDLAIAVALPLAFGGAALITLSGVVASYSRGAWLGILAGGLVTGLLFSRWARWGALLAAPLVGILILGGGPAIVPDSVAERAASGIADLRPFDAASVTITDDNFAAAERMAHWQAGMRMFADHPVTGVGAAHFNIEYRDYFVREEFRFSRGHAHNFYIHVLAELGLAGIAAYTVLIVSLGIVALSVVLYSPAGFERMLALGALGTMTSVAIHHVFENLHVLNMNIQLGAVWVLAIAAHRQWKSHSQTGMEHTS